MYTSTKFRSRGNALELSQKMHYFCIIIIFIMQTQCICDEFSPFDRFKCSNCNKFQHWKCYDFDLTDK